MSSINAPTYDPTSTAQAMAQKLTATAQEMLTSQTKSASATSTALSKLGSAISAFQTSLGSLTGIGKTMLAQSATLSNTTVGSATAKSTAAAGTYKLFVQQVATAGQASYQVPQNGDIGGQLTLTLAPPKTPATTPPSPSATQTGQFTVQLKAAADTDNDGSLSAREIAAAINSEPTNAGRVSAGVVTIDGVPQLVLTSANTGVANNVWLDPSAAGATLAGSLALGQRTVTTEAKDAILLYGATSSTTGTPITQASNTFTNIDGVSLTVTRAQTADESPFTLTVGTSTSATQSNVQAFVDAYNKLKSVIDGMVDPGDPSTGASPGAFAHDAGVRALQSRLVSMLRTTGSPSLASYGITAARDGSLSLDTGRLSKQLALDPTSLDKLIGSASTGSPKGIAGSLNTYLNQWSNSTNGQITQRNDSITKLQSSLTKRQSELDAQFNAAYDRYLKQFTDLQTLQARMNSNVSMFDALFGNDKSN